MKFVHQLFEERPSVLITCAVAAPGLEQPFTWHMALSVPPAAMNFLCRPSILNLIIMLHFSNAGRRFDVYRSSLVPLIFFTMVLSLW